MQKSMHIPLTMKIREQLLFLYKFFQSPREVGSIAPSSRFLTKRMMKPVQWDRIRSIAELGAGTGVFTRAILEEKNDACQAIIFEQDPDMRNRLALQHQDLIICEDASSLTAQLQHLRITELDCIVSGLPFANFEQELRDRIMSEVVKALKPGGTFITFQYTLQMKKQLEQQFARVEVGYVPLNMPPAFVYVCHTSAEVRDES